jgi:hypothetical protein
MLGTRASTVNTRTQAKSGMLNSNEKVTVKNNTLRFTIHSSENKVR